MILAVDIGGTKTLLAVFDDGGQIIDSVKFPTSKDFEQFKVDLATNAEKLTTKEFEIGVVGIRGYLDRKNGIALSTLSKGMESWDNAPISEVCQKVFNCSFTIENDSKLAGLSEAVALPEFSKVLYITISTGIGTALVADRDIVAMTNNSEIGKSLYLHDGRYQKWEDFASGSAMVSRYGKLAKEIDAPAIWKDIVEDWAIGIINACLAYTPDVVVIGGSVGEHFQKYETFLEDSIKRVLPSEITMPPVVQAANPEEAVIYGCYQYAVQHK